MPNLAGIAGLRAGLEFVHRESMQRIREHETTLVKRFIGAIGLYERFRLYAARGDLPRTGTVSFRLDGFSPQQLALILDQGFQITVGAGMHGCPGVHRAIDSLPDGTVRISVGWFNTEAEIDRTIAALREIADVGIDGAFRVAGLQPGAAAGAS